MTLFVSLLSKPRAPTARGSGMLKQLVGSGDRIGLFALPFFLIGVALGIVLYVGSRLFSPDEERTLTATFGTAWNDYEKRVKIPWL